MNYVDVDVSPDVEQEICKCMVFECNCSITYKPQTISNNAIHVPFKDQGLEDITLLSDLLIDDYSIKSVLYELRKIVKEDKDYISRHDTIIQTLLSSMSMSVEKKK
jgi:hypothetical protein